MTTHSAEFPSSEAETLTKIDGGKVETRVTNYPPGAELFLFTTFSVLYKRTDRPDQICKVPSPWPEFERAHEVERRIYQRLGEHPNLVRVVEMDEYGIWLKRASHGCLRQYYMEGGEATLHERIRWCENVSRVLSYVHGKNVRHADLSGRNLLVDAEKRIMLCDFGGSYIDDEKATIMAEVGYRHPDEKECAVPTIRCEIHALGSTMYEIITGKEPHHGLKKEVIAELLEREQYPDVSKVHLGDVIRKCWKGDFECVDSIAKEIASKV